MTVLRVSAGGTSAAQGMCHRGTLRVEGPGSPAHSPLVFPCSLGRSGIRADKAEGDHATPAGDYPLRRLLYRADRIPGIRCDLPAAPLDPGDGWCDAPQDRHYNRQITRPYPASHEPLWREDGLYDIIVVIGHNDDPVEPGAGSAIFLHVARSDYGPTEGCVALSRSDLEAVLGYCGPGSRIAIG